MLDLRKIDDSPDLFRVDSEKTFSGGEVPCGTLTSESSFMGKSGKVEGRQFLRNSSIVKGNVRTQQMGKDSSR